MEMKCVRLRPPPLDQPHDQCMVNPHPPHLSQMIQIGIGNPLHLSLVEVLLPIVWLDFHLPSRFNLTYSAEDEAKREQPVMIHMAVLGSVEHMLAILVEHYKGKWPFWLSPRQAIVCPLLEKSQPYALYLTKKADIYSYGIVVLELITGRKNCSLATSEEGHSLMSPIWGHYTSKTLMELLDPCLQGKCSEEVLNVFHVGL
ncbi:Aminoacyl-tRNA synthetase [Cinnamomum micranthum f. kanehirae]|uniref:Aminoacyl-tRNA synthetase n=1 Tax=Cinnamomum micranthum f. kanehirae TaxID=337451 RepID=A0A443NNQ2_9MAGN|nr:Aminoacyl-tRNA synthetase [Cinnamomum micranthum f. kanehirae]